MRNKTLSHQITDPQDTVSPLYLGKQNLRRSSWRGQDAPALCGERRHAGKRHAPGSNSVLNKETASLDIPHRLNNQCEPAAQTYQHSTFHNAHYLLNTSYRISISVGRKKLWPEVSRNVIFRMLFIGFAINIRKAFFHPWFTKAQH